jgi:hypothetical protein
MEEGAVSNEIRSSVNIESQYSCLKGKTNS